MAEPEAAEVVVGRLLRQKGLTLATAESCTGGLIGHRLTGVPGSSEYYLGGVVAYSNHAKRELLGVDTLDLENLGAVSEPVARQMAKGVREAFGADIGIGVTGIAGPGGGTPDKPVGLVYIAVDTPTGTVAEEDVLPGDRAEVKRQTAERALELIREQIA